MEELSNRKSLKQNYKDAPSTAGVYLIKNTQTGMNLLQSTQNVKGGINRRLFELKYGQDRNIKMQQDWNQYGEESFEFLIIKTVKADEQNIKSALKEMLNEYSIKLGITDDNSY